MTEKDSLKQEKLQICYVHVCGAVKSPGVYELTSDSRLYEAIQMAGGFTDEAIVLPVSAVPSYAGHNKYIRFSIGFS